MEQNRRLSGIWAKTQNQTAQQMQRTGDAQMYIAGDSMTEIIDNAGCPGTAEFANQAIQIYTR